MGHPAGPPGHITRYVYTDNRLTSLTDINDVEEVSFGYDDNGNMTSETVETETTDYEYDQENRLVRVTKNGDNYDNGYNSRSQRQTLTTPSGTDRYLHALGGLLLAEYHSDTWDADYVYLGGQPVARVWAETDTIVPEEPGVEGGAPGPIAKLLDQRLDRNRPRRLPGPVANCCCRNVYRPARVRPGQNQGVGGRFLRR